MGRACCKYSSEDDPCMVSLSKVAHVGYRKWVWNMTGIGSSVTEVNSNKGFVHVFCPCYLKLVIAITTLVIIGFYARNIIFFIYCLFTQHVQLNILWATTKMLLMTCCWLGGPWFRLWLDEEYRHKNNGGVQWDGSPKGIRTRLFEILCVSHSSCCLV